MKRSAPIAAITFDVGGTLIQPWPSVGQVYAEVAAQFDVLGLVPDALDRAFAAAWKAKGNFDHSRDAWLGLVRQTFGPRAGALSPEFFAALYERFAQPDAWRIYDDVVPVLELLAALGCQLGVISNWDERLRPLLARLRLSQYFGVMVVSVEAGHPKPAREIFQRAASSLGLPPQAILHVGDSRAEDWAGAKAAGLQALLVQRGAMPVAGEVITDLRSLEGYFSPRGTV